MFEFNEYRLGVYEKALPSSLTWNEKLSHAKNAGFDFIEMSIDESDEKIARLNWSDEEIKAFIMLEFEKGIRVESICFSAQRKYPFGSSFENIEKQGIELFQKVVVFAMKMGIRIIQLQGYDCYYNETSNDETKARFLKNLEKAANFAASFGVVLGLETMETDFMNTVSKAMNYVKKINSPYLLVYPDIGNLYNGTDNVLNDIQVGNGFICSAHIKETVTGKFREIPYGTGQVDFKSSISQLYSQGVRRFVAEFWYCNEENWEEILINNNNFIREKFTR